MTAGDFSSNRFMRSLRLRTERRRGERRRRSRTFVLLGVGLLALMVLAAPSIVCNTPLGASMLARTGAAYGWKIEAQGIQLGWITPLRLDGLKMTGPSGETVIQAQTLQTGLTLMQCAQGVRDFGTITFRNLDGTMTVAEGSSSVEDDLAAWLQAPSESPTPCGRVEIQGARLGVTDTLTGNLWQADQIQATVVLDESVIGVETQTVVTDASGGSGAVQLTATLPTAPTHRGRRSEGDGDRSAEASSVWQVDVQTNDLPLAAAVLVKRRFPDLTDALPEQLDGDVSGQVQLEMRDDEVLVATFRQLQLRNIRAADPRLGTRVWSNHLAEINGSATYTGQRVIGRGLQAKTDFGTLSMTGAFATSQPAEGSLAWLKALDGTASAEMDLAALSRAAPGLMPLRDGAEITSGRVAATVESGTDSDQQYRSKWQIRSEPIRARASGRPIVLEAVEADAVLRLSDNNVVTESVRLSSAFGTASGHGQLRSGAGTFHINFGRLAAMLRPVMELPDSTLGGIIEGKIRWDAGAGDLWDLRGDASATDLTLSLPGGRVLRQPTLNATVQATGQWAGQSLQQLTRASVSVQETRQRWTAELMQNVQQPSLSTLMPLRITGSGRLAALADLVGPWLPAELEELDGGFKADMQADVAAHSGRLRRAAIDLDAPHGRWNQRNFAQPFLKIDFDGLWAWPSGDLMSKTFTVSGDAVSLAAQGEWTPEQTDMELAWRMDLARVQRSVRPTVSTVAGNPSSGRRMAAKPVTDDRWLLQGDCDGRAVIKGSAGVWRIDTNAKGRNMALVQPALSGLVGPARPGQDAAAASHVVWAEPNALVRGIFQYDRQTGHCTAENVQVSGDWFATTLSGQASWKDAAGKLRLKGPARLNMPVVAQRLTSLTGQSIQLTGTHETPLDIQVTGGSGSAVAVNILGTVGWERGEVAGVRFHETSVPVRLTETTVFVDPATVPMDVGRLNLAGEVHYRPGPLWFEQRPGLFAEDVRLEPAMCRSWLKYLAPLAADATEVAGTFSVELDDALVVMDGTNRSRVAGRMKIQNVELNAGPLANQLISAVEQVRTFGRGLQSQPAGPPKSRRLMAMPPQTVDFSLADGVVNHQRLYLQIDDASLITSGSVSLDGRLNLLAQVPLQASWLGSDLQGLAGQAVSLPVAGTLSRPSLDSGAVRQLVSQVGTAAVQQTAEHFLQQQTNKAMQKLFGR